VTTAGDTRASENAPRAAAPYANSCGPRGSRVLPFSATYNLSVAITATGMPIAASLAAGVDAPHPLTLVRNVVAWHRRAAVYLPGATGATVNGYRLVWQAPTATATDDRLTITTVRELWD
jgi:hypothetical protein